MKFPTVFEISGCTVHPDNLSVHPIFLVWVQAVHPRKNDVVQVCFFYRNPELLNFVNKKTEKKQNIPDQNESKDKTLKTYKFQDSWKDSFPWLEYSQD